ncbi:putative aliphatic sulfonates-binding protein precursor [Variibacter gotjawalensis]|uniref:Putative aliphatic sulfonates-binding protein n=1 Tax=Variibacter gotjawalensis TaxID=1333996 RepID=A0A0S3PTU0_9BRAD|nr:ABC transporter substrate-binding protein [Variibacter gotjawalensis]NIK49694.1 NitT/TauT family transport system substrate-binding protein [Variibacter gotjawalensis]RZS45706.1 NitT/TauT family transport system substrate-binding protein [Variibacter gotjawalensis]BAT59377.1 putative aliphatic sulfonates-binding protein precursor [Variibacter gotjawalensis]
MTTRRSFVIGTGALALSATTPALAQEKKSLTLGVGGKGLLYYLPLTLAERLGYFKEQGLDVTITDFGGGAKSLQSLIGGSADVVTGAYEHTIRMQVKNQPIVAVTELGRFPGIVIAVRKDRADKIKTLKDLKGAKIGVTAPGSSTHFFANALIGKEGLKTSDVSIIGIGGGAGAVAAMKKGDIDAISNLDPVISKLEQDGDIVVLADSRSEEGNQKLFGGNNPAAVVYFKADFVQKNPETVQRVVNAFYKTLKWLEKASADDVAKTVPPEYHLGDVALYKKAFEASKAMYSKDGIVSDAGMKNAYGMLKDFDEELKGANVDLSKTFDARFVKKAAGGA